MALSDAIFRNKERHKTQKGRKPRVRCTGLSDGEATAPQELSMFVAYV